MASKIDIGAGKGTRTLKLARRNLNPVCLPISSYPHIQFYGRLNRKTFTKVTAPKSNESTNSTTPAYSVDSGEWTVDNYCFAVLTMAVSIFPVLCNHCKLMKILFRTSSPLPEASEASNSFLLLLSIRCSFWR